MKGIFMNRRILIRGIGASAVVAALPSFTQAQWAYCGDATPTTETPRDYGWDFTDFTVQGSIERYWLGTPDAAHEAVFGDSPIDSKEHPVENLVEFDTDIKNARAWEGNLWHEDIPTIKVMIPIDEFVWVVVADAETPMDVIQFMFDAVQEFGEPRVPRGWGIPTEYWFD